MGEHPGGMADPRMLDARFHRGHVLGGRYELRSILGQGGMAEVYLGWDRLLRRRVAVKVLWEGLARDRRFLVRFRREAHAVAALSHPNIVSVFDAGSDAGTPFIVMELVDGLTLADALWEQGPLPTDRALRVARAVAAALGHAHRAGIVHRDVKPANIMLTEGGGVKVLDFGIARAVAWTPVTVPWGLHGTAEYISPEQIKGEPVDGRSDVYALGVVLFEALTGSPPYAGESALAVAYKHLQQEPPRPSRINPEVPASLDDVVRTCLAKDPRARYQRAEQLRVELDRLADSGPAAMPLQPQAGPAPVAPHRAEHPAEAAHDTDEVEPGWEEPRMPGGTGRWKAVAVGLIVVAVVVATVAAALAWPFRAPGPAARTPSPPAPSLPPPLLAPTAMRAADSCDGFLTARIDLAWTPSSSRVVDGYEVYRSISPGGPYEMIGLVLGRARAAYADRDLDTGTDYHYLVKSTGDGRRSTGSARAHARTNGFCV